jgi:phospholipase C
VIKAATDRVGMSGKVNWEDDARGAAQGRGELEGLQRPDRHLGLGVLSYCKNYTNPFSITGLELIDKGLAPTHKMPSQETTPPRPPVP